MEDAYRREARSTPRHAFGAAGAGGALGLLALRVAARLTTASALVAAEGVLGAGASMPKSAITAGWSA